MKIVPVNRQRPELFAGYPDLMTPADVAEATRQSAQTVRRLMSAGEIPAVKIGARWYAPRADLARLVEEGVCHVA